MSNEMKTFTVAGTSNLNGVVKFRFANDLKSRIKVLERNGHTDVQLVELPNAMTKEQAIAWLESQSDAAPAADADADGEVSEEAAEEAAEETADSIRESLDADGEDTSEMSQDFLQEVADRENADEEAA